MFGEMTHALRALSYRAYLQAALPPSHFLEERYVGNGARRYHRLLLLYRRLPIILYSSALAFNSLFHVSRYEISRGAISAIGILLIWRGTLIDGLRAMVANINCA